MTILTLRDLIANYNGCSVDFDLTIPSVSNKTAAELIPARGASSMVATQSETLRWKTTESQTKLPSEVMLRVQCNSVFLAAVKFGAQFQPPISWTIEQNSLTAYMTRTAPLCYIRVIAVFSDLQATTSSQIDSHIEYAIHTISQADVSRRSTVIDFLTDGRIKQSTGSITTMYDRKPPQIGFDRGRTVDQIKIIDSQQPIAEGWVIESSFARIFPTRKSGSSHDRYVEISEKGITIKNESESSAMELFIPANETDQVAKPAGMKILTSGCRLVGRISLSGLRDIAKCASAQATITISFFNVGGTYYVRFNIPFSSLSSGSIYTQIIVGDEQSASSPHSAAPSSMPPTPLPSTKDEADGYDFDFADQ